MSAAQQMTEPEGADTRRQLERAMHALADVLRAVDSHQRGFPGVEAASRATLSEVVAALDAHRVRAMVDAERTQGKAPMMVGRMRR